MVSTFDARISELFLCSMRHSDIRSCQSMLLTKTPVRREPFEGCSDSMDVKKMPSAGGVASLSFWHGQRNILERGHGNIDTIQGMRPSGPSGTPCHGVSFNLRATPSRRRLVSPTGNRHRTSAICRAIDVATREKGARREEFGRQLWGGSPFTGLVLRRGDAVALDSYLNTILFPCPVGYERRVQGLLVKVIVHEVLTVSIHSRALVPIWFDARKTC